MAQPSVTDVANARKRGDVAGFVAALASTDKNVRLVAVNSLRQLASPTTIEPLIRVARDSADVDLRVVALKALGTIGDEQIADAIFEIGASDAPLGVRTTAISVLAERDDARATGLLVDMLRDPPPRRETGLLNRRSTIRWLMQTLVALHAREAIPAIEASVPRLGALERRHARRALARLRR